MSDDRCTIPDGDPIPMTEFTLGKPYTSKDMHRDMGIERRRQGLKLCALLMLAVHAAAAAFGVIICLVVSHEIWWQPIAVFGASFAIVTPIACGFLTLADRIGTA